MSDHKTEVAGLVQQIRDAEITCDLDPFSGGLRRTREQLAQVEFHSVSPCRSVAVYMTAGGAVKDIVIREDALNRLDHDQMARRITEVITQADEVATDAVSALTGRLQSGRGAR